MIELLPDFVINQIAAGEVVENPASAVKEILENACDAGGRRISVEVEGGGHHLIRISDDGVGMSRADVELCLLRYATSKIRAVADLDALSTMGFRGEALAAIASVSRLEIQTNDGAEGTRLRAEGGTVMELGPVARNRGTTVEVRDLFFNAPARRKFQKGAASSQSQIRRVVETVALAHPEIAISLRAGGQVVFEVEATAHWLERACALLDWKGREVSGIGVVGLVGDAAGTRAGQQLFVNRRPVYSPLVSRAVKDAYGTRIPEALHPRFLLFVEMDPRDVDVNVHPQKREVRFRDESNLYNRIRAAVIASFEQPREAVAYEVPQFVLREEPQMAPPVMAARPAVAPAVLLPDPEERLVALVGSFALMEDGDGLFAVDLRRLATVVLQGPPQPEPLLWPIEVDLDPGEEAPLEGLACLGVEARTISARRLVIDALPAGVCAQDVPLLLKAARTGRPLEAHNLTQRKYSRDEAVHLWGLAKRSRPQIVRLHPHLLERLFS